MIVETNKNITSGQTARHKEKQTSYNVCLVVRYVPYGTIWSVRYKQSIWYDTARYSLLASIYYNGHLRQLVISTETSMVC